MRKGSGDGATVAAVVAIIACCGVPLLAIAAGGAIAAVGGLAARYWPLTALGVALAVWAGVKLGRLLRARSRSLREHQVSDR